MAGFIETRAKRSDDLGRARIAAVCLAMRIFIPTLRECYAGLLSHM